MGTEKLLNKYLGPIEIVSRKGTRCCGIMPAYVSKMCNAFHVSLLKQYKDGYRRSAPAPDVLDDGEMECEVDRGLAHCDTKTGSRSYYVQWKGLPLEENERLTASKLKNVTDVVP